MLGHLDALEHEIARLEAEMARHGREGAEVAEDLAHRYDRARSEFELGGGFARAAQVERVLGGLGFAEPARGRSLSSFSGGWLMRVELAKLLLSAPDVLLLDEPTNHLDLPSIAWFEETLREYRGAALIVSHDRTFLRRHATRVAELENARFTVFEGGYDRFVTQKEERRLQLEAEARSQGRKIAETERFIERFRYKASKARQVQSRVKSLAKLERVELAPESRRSMRLRIPAPARAGDVVLRLEGVHKRYGETIVYRGVDFLLRRGDRVALAGPNGAGKSTLLRIAAGALGFDAGSRTLGHNATVGFYAQHQLETLEGSRSVLAELESVAGVRGRAPAARTPGRLPLLGRRRPEEGLGALGRREGAAGAGQDAAAAGQLPGARRADQPPRRGGLRGAGRRARGLPGDAALHLARPRLHQRARDARGRGPRRRAARPRRQLRRLRALGGCAAADDGPRRRRRPALRAARRSRARRRPAKKSGSRRASRTSSAPGRRCARASAWRRWRRRSRGTRPPSSSSAGGSELPRCTATAMPCARWRPSEASCAARWKRSTGSGSGWPPSSRPASPGELRSPSAGLRDFARLRLAARFACGAPRLRAASIARPGGSHAGVLQGRARRQDPHRHDRAAGALQRAAPAREFRAREGVRRVRRRPGPVGRDHHRGRRSRLLRRATI